MTFTNALGVPEQLGTSAIIAGNAIAEALSKADKKLIASYDAANRKIVILNSQALPYEFLTTILYDISCNPRLNYIPQIEKTKSPDGNWQITLIYTEQVKNSSIRKGTSNSLGIPPRYAETNSTQYQSVDNDGRNWPANRILPLAKH
jgi:hypothetical protein